MHPQENLRQAKAAFDGAIDTLLENVAGDEMAFRRNFLDCHTAGRAYAQALGAAAPTVSRELGEAYQAEAATVAVSVSHLMSFLTGYRTRHPPPP